jgi:thiol-disulfide isomerase/thioredoxin
MSPAMTKARLKILLLFFLLPLGYALAESPIPKGILELDGKTAPALVLEDMDQQIFNLTMVRGKWVFVHFWASWCGPCRKEMPTIQAIAKEFADSNLHIVLINTAEDEDTVFGFLGGVAPDLNSLMDIDGKVTEKWQPRGLPSTYLVNPEGKLKYIALGGRPWDKPKYLNFLKWIIR